MGQCLHLNKSTGARDRKTHLIRWLICHDCGHSYFIDVPRHKSQSGRGLSQVGQGRRDWGHTGTFVDWSDGKEKAQMSTDNSNGFKQWMIVELFGHQVIAGLVSEQTIGGSSFIRVDVPATEKREAYTRFFGDKAIYAMTPVDEATAKAAVKAYSQAPIQEYKLRAALPPGDDDDDDDEDEWG
jgi:hypothetical protein